MLRRVLLTLAAFAAPCFAQASCIDVKDANSALEFAENIAVFMRTLISDEARLGKASKTENRASLPILLEAASKQSISDYTCAVDGLSAYKAATNESVLHAAQVVSDSLNTQIKSLTALNTLLNANTVSADKWSDWIVMRDDANARVGGIPAAIESVLVDQNAPKSDTHQRLLITRSQRASLLVTVRSSTGVVPEADIPSHIWSGLAVLGVMFDDAHTDTIDSPPHLNKSKLSNRKPLKSPAL